MASAFYHSCGPGPHVLPTPGSALEKTQEAAI